MKHDHTHRLLRTRVEAKLREHRVEYAIAEAEPYVALVVRGSGGWYLTARELAFFLQLGKLTAAELEALKTMWPAIAADWRAKVAA